MSVDSIFFINKNAPTKTNNQVNKPTRWTTVFSSQSKKVSRVQRRPENRTHNQHIDIYLLTFGVYLKLQQHNHNVVVG